MKMKRGMKVARITLLGVLASAAVAATAHGRAQRAREAGLWEHPLGQMVEVDGHRMCVFTQGEGKHTLVFLSGGGTVSPILDFKSLYSRLSNGCRIVVIELGCGHYVHHFEPERIAEKTKVFLKTLERLA